jgi:hypothetical protein
MADVISEHHHDAPREGGGHGVLIGVIIAILVLLAIFAFGRGFGRSGSNSGTNNSTTPGANVNIEGSYTPPSQ